MNSSSKLLIAWLRNAGYHLDEKYFLQQFLSHPDAPGAAAITDTLNEVSIDNMAIEIPFSELHKLEEPFMAYIKQNREEQFALVHQKSNNNWEIKLKADEQIIVPPQKFKELFSGLAIIIDTAPKQSSRRVLNIFKPQYILPAVIVLGFISLFILQPAPVVHFVFSIAGLLVSMLIAAKELGLNTGKLDKFCHLSTATDCETVLQSKYSGIFKNIKLSDLSLVFFAWQTFAWLFIFPLNTAAAYYQYAVSLAAAPVTIASIYLQKFVLKKWCPLCLLVCGALWGQAITAGLVFFYGGIMEFNLSVTLTFVVALAMLGTAWQFIKQLLQQSIKNETLNTQLLSFRRNYKLFMPMHKQLPEVQTSIGIRDIVLGPENAPVQMIVVSNPLCTACISLHKQLNKWLEQCPELSITIRFYVPVENNTDKRTLVAAKLVELYMNNAQAGLAAIDAWYDEPDFDKFYERNSLIHHKDALQVIKQHRKWCHDQNIFVTPSIIVNKKRFPLFYEPEDIRFFLEELVSVSNGKATYQPPEPAAVSAVLS